MTNFLDRYSERILCRTLTKKAMFQIKILFQVYTGKENWNNYAVSRGIDAGMKEYTGRHKGESKYSKRPVNQGAELPGRSPWASWPPLSKHSLCNLSPPAREHIVRLWEGALFQSTNLACCVLQFLKLTQNPNKNMAGVELHTKDTVTWFL